MSELKLDKELKSPPASEKTEKKEDNWFADGLSKAKDFLLQTGRLEAEKKAMAEILNKQQGELKAVSDRYHAEKSEVIGAGKQAKSELLRDISVTVSRLEMERTPGLGGDESQRKVAEDAYERLEAKITGTKEVVDFKDPDSLKRAIDNLNEFASAIEQAPAKKAEPAMDAVAKPVDAISVEAKPLDIKETAGKGFRFSTEDAGKMTLFGLTVDDSKQDRTIVAIPKGYSVTVGGDKMSIEQLAFPKKDFKSATVETSADDTVCTIVAETVGGQKVAAVIGSGKAPTAKPETKPADKKAPEGDDSEKAIRDMIGNVKVPKGHSVEFNSATGRVSLLDAKKRTIGYFTAGTGENKDKSDAAGLQKWVDRMEKRLQPTSAKPAEAAPKASSEAGVDEAKKTADAAREAEHSKQRDQAEANKHAKYSPTDATASA